MDSILVILSAVILLALSALFSGLTLGLMSLSVFELKRKAELGDTEAKLVYPIRARGTELLVTLILGNVLVNAALTVVLNSFLAGFLAVLVATVLITLIGEILPQAFLKKNGLKFGARLAPYIERVLNVMRPISQPLGRLLDDTIGGEVPTIYSQDELIKILEEHAVNPQSEIEANELDIVRHALTFGDKLIENVMTPKSMIVAVEKNQEITPALLDKLHQSGHSRFPVYEETIDHLVGMLYLRDLINLKENKTAGQAASDRLSFVNENEPLDHALSAFLKSKQHLFIVINEFEETVGVLSIEDVLEEILGREIVDEFDHYDDLRAVAHRQGKQRNRSRAGAKE